jgi:8-oxo-dGTP diphosphatase
VYVNNKLHIVTAVAVIVRDDGKILLLKRASHEKVYPNCFTFPGGKVEGNDTISETLVKEVREECGLVLRPGAVLLKEKSIGRPDGSTSKSLSFLCTVESTENVVIDENDFTEYMWASLSDLASIEHVGIESEFIKVANIINASLDLQLIGTDTDKVDFRL